jgi:hypothetical protein
MNLMPHFTHLPVPSVNSYGGTNIKKSFSQLLKRIPKHKMFTCEHNTLTYCTLLHILTSSYLISSEMNSRQKVV